MQTHKRQSITRNPNPRHANQMNNTNTTEHELKYPEASRSSFLKLMLGKLKPQRGHAKQLQLKPITSMVKLKDA